jgi:hypothetical protein
MPGHAKNHRGVDLISDALAFGAQKERKTK